MGSVQGVGFRHWTQLQGRQRNLKGYVHNLADDSVEVVASGCRDALEELLTLLR
ncbi:MAG: acylphosphatase [Chloroflexi bacterium]|nr:acylphosphatase [Chloroflexota bacterium]